MARFRSIPTLIDAYRVNRRTVIPPQKNNDHGIYIVYPGDYLCIDHNGCKFPCKADVFERCYEPVEE